MNFLHLTPQQMVVAGPVIGYMSLSWIFAALMHVLPKPETGGKQWYLVLYALLQFIAANLGPASKSGQLPGDIHRTERKGHQCQIATRAIRQAKTVSVTPIRRKACCRCSAQSWTTWPRLRRERHKENKDRLEQIHEEVKATNGDVRSLKEWRAAVSSGFSKTKEWRDPIVTLLTHVGTAILGFALYKIFH